MVKIFSVVFGIVAEGGVQSAGFPALQGGEFHSGQLSFVTFMENIMLPTVVLHQIELWQ